MSLGQRIRQLRQMRGLTQAELGGQELSKSFISLLEKGRAQPSLDTLMLLARRLGTSVDALLGQNGHLPEMVCEGLLTLVREAVRAHKRAVAEQLLAPVRFLAGRHGLEEATLEAALQEAQLDMDDRQFDDAWVSLERVRERSETAGDFWRLGRALVMMGSVKLRSREIRAARPLLEEALTTLRRARAGRDPARVEALIALGTLLARMGDFTGAVRRYEEAAGSDAARHHAPLRGQALWGIGFAYRKMGRFPAAAQYLLQAKDVFEEAEELADLMNVLGNLGDLLRDQGQFREALRYYHHALRVMQRLGKRAKAASTMTEIGRVHLALGNVAEAAHFAGRAFEEAREINDPLESAEAQVVLAGVARSRRDGREAVRLYKAALSAFQERFLQPKVAEVARELGLLLRERGAHAQAASYLAMSLDRGVTTETVSAPE